MHSVPHQVEGIDHDDDNIKAHGCELEMLEGRSSGTPETDVFQRASSRWPVCEAIGPASLMRMLVLWQHPMFTGG